MSAHARQRELPHVGSRRLDPNWRAHREELLAAELREADLVATLAAIATSERPADSLKASARIALKLWRKSKTPRTPRG